MEKLDKAYKAVEMLEQLGLPVSHEQQAAIAHMEKEYLRDEIIPLIKQELEPLVKHMRNRFTLDVSFSKENGVDIELSGIAVSNHKSSPSNNDSSYRKKKYILRVVFPNNTVSCNKIVSKTFIEVVKYAGARNVERLGIMMLGENIVSPKLYENEKNRMYQHEVEPGYYVCTYCNTDRKFDALNTINRELNLNLKIEKVFID